MYDTRLSLLLASLALVGGVAPAVAVGAGRASALGDAAAQTDAPTVTGFETNISVRPGAQLSTVLTATTGFARSAIETSAFEREGEHGNERACAEAVADCAEAIRGDYEDAIESDH